MLQLKVCFLYLGNVFVLKRYARFKDVHSFFKEGVRFKDVCSLQARCVCFKDVRLF